MLAVLARRFGDLGLADDAVQEALVEAVTAWAEQGVPATPAAWLMTVARRKAVDRLRRSDSARRRTTAVAADLIEGAEPAIERGLVEEGMDVGDERLRLMLLCCHPALRRDAQVALTLRLVGGLTTTEIAAAFLVPEPTVTQRIVRSKRKIRDAVIPLSVPADPGALAARVDVLLAVLYLVFNEGYLSRGSDAVLRVDLCDEAVRLAAAARALLPVGSPAWSEASGLLALMRYQRARFATRLDAAGDLVLLEDQDRTRWDGRLIAEANTVLEGTFGLTPSGPYQLQAVVAGLHANARTAADTDWAAVASAYARLDSITGSPVVRLNRAVAVAMADGPHAGLALLETVTGLDDYHLLHATRGDLLERVGDPVGAATSYRRALELTSNPAERRHLERRLVRLDRP